MAAQLSVQAPGGSRNGLRLETHTTLAGCWTARSFNMKQKLWMLAFVLALPSTGLDVFHGGREADETLETQRQLPSPQE